MTLPSLPAGIRLEYEQVSVETHCTLGEVTQVMNDLASEHNIDGATMSGPNTAEGTHRPTGQAAHWTLL
ncbi:hypothetical protein B5P44_00030 [Mycobacterium sp. CBMA 213]|uniref:Uncharacterized protein n=1 Tax=Mycolicibacterium sp. CBMA 213 TaxID=1968788 RepID=A0A343VQX7_9MYCO|nr:MULTISPECIES: hypothetical protein [unclassified Mycolicibacterium]AVN58301.1 hypothetical protein B5P44_p00006 [Mycolicibacterium sp. CBMA 213]MUL60971.1 hypothetical protein [Mycolicibacterium sp. CBMA 335]MUM03210.1 hypothetical protein [Mycolicibacterium sp. CBMA 213]